MNLLNKNILIIGLAKTGVSTLKFLHKLNANLIVNDIKEESQLEDILKELKEFKNIKYVLGKYISDISDLDLVVVSPGVPLDLPLFESIKENNIEIIGEVELAYRMFSSNSHKPNIVAITGTNGKTTTTSLTAELFKNAEKDAYIVGNIGNPIIDIVDKIDSNANIIAELSSFQLESINTFNPSISVILNITPDHLNRHITMKNYIDAKAKIFKNHNKENITILNYDDINTRELSSNIKNQCIYFSTKCNLDLLKLKGAYIDSEGFIIININETIKLMNIKELSLPGVHNVQNSLATALIGYICNLPVDIIKHTLNTFAGVEHRQEFVREINGVRYINDSKATNPDSTIKALNSYDNGIILIAGGMDKKNDFSELAEEIIKNTKGLIVFGETAQDILKEAWLKGYEKITSKTKNLEEAVKIASKLGECGDVILLSPACASWDMYKNFEERGNEFKKIVYSL